MPKNTVTGTDSQVPNPQLLWGCLSSICMAVGHTFSWYTSKKGRAWLAIKCNAGAGYTTSVEYSAALSDEATFDMLVILMYKHMRKVCEIEPPVTTWLNGKMDAEVRLEAYKGYSDLLSEFVQKMDTDGMAVVPSIQAVLAEHGYKLDVDPTLT